MAAPDWEKPGGWGAPHDGQPLKEQAQQIGRAHCCCLSVPIGKAPNIGPAVLIVVPR